MVRLIDCRPFLALISWGSFVFAGVVAHADFPELVLIAQNLSKLGAELKSGELSDMALAQQRLSELQDNYRAQPADLESADALCAGLFALPTSPEQSMRWMESLARVRLNLNINTALKNLNSEIFRKQNQIAGWDLGAAGALSLSKDFFIHKWQALDPPRKVGTGGKTKFVGARDLLERTREVPRYRLQGLVNGQDISLNIVQMSPGFILIEDPQTKERLEITETNGGNIGVRGNLKGFQAHGILTKGGELDTNFANTPNGIPADMRHLSATSYFNGVFGKEIIGYMRENNGVLIFLGWLGGQYFTLELRQGADNNATEVTGRIGEGEQAKKISWKLDPSELSLTPFQIFLLTLYIEHP